MDFYRTGPRRTRCARCYDFWHLREKWPAAGPMRPWRVPRPVPLACIWLRAADARAKADAAGSPWQRSPRHEPRLSPGRPSPRCRCRRRPPSQGPRRPSPGRRFPSKTKFGQTKGREEADNSVGSRRGVLKSGEAEKAQQ